MIKSLRFYKEFTINYFQIFLVINAFQKWSQNHCRSLTLLTLGFRNIFFFLTTLLSKTCLRITVGALLQVLETFFFLENSKNLLFPKMVVELLQNPLSVFLSIPFHIFFILLGIPCLYLFLYLFIHHYFYPCFYPPFYHYFHPFFDRQLKLDTFQKSSWNGCRNPS